jgi:glycosyltransferase involved in cell wall biosynthesis
MTLIDVIIPVRNVDAYLAAAITSALNQVNVSTRVIVVDAGSDAPITLTHEHAASPRVTLVRSDAPLLAGGARNAALPHCSGDFLSFLDADDLWPDNRCANLVDSLATTHADLALGHVTHFGDAAEGLVIPAGASPAYLAGGTLMPRKTFDAVGLFDPTLRVGEFIEWFNRLTRMSLSVSVSPETSLLRRVHGRSSTSTAAAESSSTLDDHRADYLKVVRAWMTPSA